jgi:hypothetical protein
MEPFRMTNFIPSRRKYKSLSHYELYKLYVLNGIIAKVKNQSLGFDNFTVNSLHLFVDNFRV